MPWLYHHVVYIDMSLDDQQLLPLYYDAIFPLLYCPGPTLTTGDG